MFLRAKTSSTVAKVVRVAILWNDNQSELNQMKSEVNRKDDEVNRIPKQRDLFPVRIWIEGVVLGVC